MSIPDVNFRRNGRAIGAPDRAQAASRPQKNERFALEECILNVRPALARAGSGLIAGIRLTGGNSLRRGNGRQAKDVNRKVQYDFYYIEYFSPWLDLLIAFRTIKTMLTGFGSR